MFNKDLYPQSKDTNLKSILLEHIHYMLLKDKLLIYTENCITSKKALRVTNLIRIVSELRKSIEKLKIRRFNSNSIGQLMHKYYETYERVFMRSFKTHFGALRHIAVTS
jgi:hypothetical protein